MGIIGRKLTYNKRRAVRLNAGRGRESRKFFFKVEKIKSVERFCRSQNASVHVFGSFVCGQRDAQRHGFRAACRGHVRGLRRHWLLSVYIIGLSPLWDVFWTGLTCYACMPHPKKRLFSVNTHENEQSKVARRPFRLFLFVPRLSLSVNPMLPFSRRYCLAPPCSLCFDACGGVCGISLLFGYCTASPCFPADCKEDP